MENIGLLYKGCVLDIGNCPVKRENHGVTVILEYREEDDHFAGWMKQVWTFPLN